MTVGWNDGVRFLLELAGLWGFGAGGWVLGRGLWRWLLVIVLPLLAALIWATFRVPGDPGPAPVAVPGPIRLGLELAVLAGGAVGLGLAYGPTASAVYAVVAVLHYVVALARVRSLLQG